MAAKGEQNWPRVNRDRPCPVCGKDHACKISPNGEVAMCRRVADGAFKTLSGEWFLHRLKDQMGFYKRRGDIKTMEKPKNTLKSYSTLELAKQAAAAGAKGQEAGEWVYRRADGSESFRVVRFNKSNGGKEYRPIHQAKEGWRISDPSGPLPLYRLPDLPTSGVVWITEGEKAADAAHALGLAATTSAHGAGSAEKTDWTPLAGREVGILPDQDGDGEKYAKAVTQVLVKLRPPARVKIVHLPGLPAKGDIVEFIEARKDQKPDSVRSEIEAIEKSTAPVNISEVAGGPVLRCLADVEAEAVHWLWPGRLAIGKLSLLFGDPGRGKSFITLDFAARVSTGAEWPDGSGNAPLGSVILLNCEDDAGDTIRPRLDRAGADVSKILLLDAVKHTGRDGQVVERMFTIADVDALRNAVDQHPDTKLIIIDPVSAYLDKTDGNNNCDVRGLLAPLQKLASDRRLAIVMVTHMNKAGGSQAMYRAMGSLAFAAAARAAWAVVPDKDDPARRLFLPAKNNLGNDRNGLAYRIIDGAVAWESDPVNMTADEAMGAEAASPPGPKPVAMEKATCWLRSLLRDEPKPVTEIESAAKQAGICVDGALRRAKEALGIKPYKPSFDGGWWWRLPEGVQAPLSPRTCSSSQTPNLPGFDFKPRVGLPDGPPITGVPHLRLVRPPDPSDVS